MVEVLDEFRLRFWYRHTDNINLLGGWKWELAELWFLVSTF